MNYDALRATLQAFVDGIDTARDTLVAAAEAGGDWVVDVDLARVRVDLDGDGTGSDAESLAAIAAAMAGELMAGPVPLAVPNLVPDTTPPARGGAGAQVRPSAAKPESASTVRTASGLLATRKCSRRKWISFWRITLPPHSRRSVTGCS